MNKIIGERTGQGNDTLLIVLGQIHGNEPAGTKAIETVFRMLDDEPKKNPNFKFNGKILGLLGNKRAAELSQRYVEKDLNRMWLPEILVAMAEKSVDLWTPEEREVRANVMIVNEVVSAFKPKRIMVLDLHTTSSEGGIFTVPPTKEDGLALTVSRSLLVPVVHGLTNELKGTSLQYFSKDNFDVPTACVLFEGGQHDNPESVENCISAIINTMRTLEILDPEDVEHKHDERLQKSHVLMPKEVEVSYRFDIKPNTNFKMRPGYVGFQPLKKGEHVADDINGEILCPLDGYMLMPLYQSQGTDGFFVVV